MRKMYSSLVLTFISLACIFGQDVVSYEYRGYVGRDSIENESGIAVDNGVHVYSLTYTCENLLGQPDTASGLICFPDTNRENYPAVVYQHGTSNERNDVPSNLRSGAPEAIFYAANGFITLAADYFGLGVSDGLHPYIHARTEARAAAWLLEAGSKLSAELGYEWNEYLFVAGYSQGGHAALALHQYLAEEQSAKWPVTASAPMSGPHALSTVMRDVILSDEEYLFTGYIVYITLGFDEVYGSLYDDLTDFYKPQYIAAIEAFANEQVDLAEMTFSLGLDLFIRHGKILPKLLLQDSVLQAFQNDPDHILQRLLAENDTYKWRSDVPIRLYHCEADEQVPYQNSIEAASEMQARGSADVQAVSIDPNLDHSGCAVPAITRSIQFFKSFLPPLARKDHRLLSDIITVFPNPAGTQIHWPAKNLSPNTLCSVYDLNGRPVIEDSAASGSLSIEGLSPGMYVLTVTDRNRIRTARFVKH